ncbi:MAG TPA: hypothetical protein PK125_13400 [Syntrophorhabdus sp.]|nr:hypothetical protein [Syntrophorhabdus sp.]
MKFKNSKLAKTLSLFISSLIILSCQPKIPKEALILTPESLENRQLQTRKYETSDEMKILGACAALLQDLGFGIDESETELGVLVGSKTRSAENAGQIVGAVILAILIGAYMPTDRDQVMRACIVTKPSEENHCSVRVTFQRIVFNSRNEVSCREFINDPEIYRDFFEKLSKAIFLEAQGV